MEKGIIKFIEFIAESYIYETEYDGRMYRYCFYCDRDITMEEKHEEDCLHLQAKEFLTKHRR